MEGHKIHHVGLTVKNMDKLISFFEKLGFKLEKIVRNEQRGLTLAFLQLDNFSIELYKWDNISEQSDIFHIPGYHHLAFKVDNIDVVAKKLQGLMVEFPFEVLIPPKKVVHKNLGTNKLEERKIMFIKIDENVVLEFYE
ncbi:MAG: VOC family protein [Nitrososphaerota archaeon]